jgi:hypothetical protein
MVLAGSEIGAEVRLEPGSRIGAIATWIPSSPSSATPIGDCPVAYCSDHYTFFSKRSFERVENSVVAYSCRPQGPQATK